MLVTGETFWLEKSNVGFLVWRDVTICPGLGGLDRDYPCELAFWLLAVVHSQGGA